MDEHILRQRQQNSHHHGHGHVNGNGHANTNANTEDPPVTSSSKKKKKKQHRRRGSRSKLRLRKETEEPRRNGTQVFLPRMILRNKPYNQSNNQCQVVNTNRHRSKIFRLLLSDWFHVLLRIKMHYSIMMLLCGWLGMILFLAVFYMKIDQVYVDDNCGLGDPPDHISFAAAFAFSLETCTTVGCK